MKQIDFVVPVQVTETLKFEIKGNYQQPENVDEINGHYQDKKELLRIFNTGLRQIERNKLKAENNIVPVAKKLVDLKVYKTIEESLDFILTQKGLK
jgi:hypothetical protein